MVLRLQASGHISTGSVEGGGVKGKHWMGALSGMTALFLLLSLACSRDPNVRKQKYFESGKRYFAEGRYRAAAIQFTNAVLADPNFGAAHDYLAQSYLRMEEWNNAYQELNRTIELEPTNYRARIDLVNLLIASNQLREAEEKTDSLLEQDSEDPQVHATVASLLSAQGKANRAIDEMEKAVSHAPAQSNYRIALGLLEIKANQPDKAELTFKQAVEVDPKSVSPLIALGGYYLQFNRYAEAQQQFLRAKDVEPKNPEVWSDLARVQLAQGKTADAEHIMQQAKQELSRDPKGYRLLGDFYLSTNQIDKALTEYASLYRYHSDDLTVAKNYIQALIIKGRIDEAAKLNESLLNKHPKDTDALFFEGQILNRQGRYQEAEKALQTILNDSPDNAPAHYQLGVAFNGLGNFERAEREWRQAVSTRPDLLDAQNALAMMAMQKGDMAAVASIGDDVVHSQPNVPDGYLLRAASEISQDRFVQAHADLDQVRKLAPDNPNLYIQTGSLQVAEHRLPEAESSYEQALKIDPTSLGALRGLLGVSILEKQPQKALARIDAQTAASNTSTYHYLRAMALLNLPDLAGGEKELQTAIALDKSNIEAIEALGRVEVARGSLDQAIAVYQQAVADNPTRDQLYVTLGSLLEAKGNLDGAQQAYRKALQLSSDNADAANNLAYLLLKKGDDSDVTLNLAQQARRAMPSSPNAADTLGLAYFRRGMYAQATDLFREAATKVPDNATYQYHLGMAYQSEKRVSEARLHLERVLKINPNYENAGDVRRALAELQ
jgi:Flp pilus assembly protein TadD